MENLRIKQVVIVGGGTAGWMTAAALSKFLPTDVKIHVVESDEISTVGVGEATIPKIKLFNNALEIDQNDFIRQTKGTFKLGIEFVNWGKLGDSYIHGFGEIGRQLGLVDFHHYWERAAQHGAVPPLQEFSICDMAARAGKFMRPIDEPNSPLSRIAYAFHFDAGLYAAYLRRHAEARKVVRIEGKIVQTLLRPDNGYIDAIVLENGEKISGDLFIDCSGFRGLLIEQALHTGYEDWTHFLPCDRAVAVPCAATKPPTPYTRSTAHAAGWQWRIPLQHRVGNGHVYCSQYMSDDEATAILLNNLDGEPLAEPRMLKFTTGMRKKTWHKNCIAIGLSSGFMEPLESTSIHLIQSSIARLMSMFPSKVINELEVDEFNRQARFEVERIRDFLIFHYHYNQRTDSAFWTACREMAVPQKLTERIALFKAKGLVFREADEMFALPNWLEVMHGQNLRAENYHPLANALSLADNFKFLEIQHKLIQEAVQKMPTHQDFIRRHCAIAGF